MTERKTLGKVELDLLQAVDQLQPVSVRTLAEHLASRTGQARTTVLTTLERLRKKGYLSRRSIKGVNHYSTRQSVTEILPRLVGEFVHKMLGGSVSPVVAYLQDRNLDAEELEQLKALVEELQARQSEAEEGS
ncbi:Penicillinase repressor [Bremerella volcania]|uniref:Penicillinase repressor n=1 Tax=Bremerella volcania TaxID=2527984 RepID=A0A518CFF2_9BACT|nr:BlaI/MecI/CopY family transcriptional regulator [Bremerella volcania]QDU77960.1 Penicillinase repressor [Bremerella volcania]